MHKRQLEKNKTAAFICDFCAAFNCFCFGWNKYPTDVPISKLFFVLAAVLLGAAYAHYRDSRVEIHTRGSVYLAFCTYFAITLFLLHILFSWWILALFIVESAALITLIIRFRPIV